MNAHHTNIFPSRTNTKCTPSDSQKIPKSLNLNATLAWRTPRKMYEGE